MSKLNVPEKLTVDWLLNVVDLEFKNYIPSAVAFEFFSFIRLSLGEEPENANPLAHYFLIDTIFQQDNVEYYYKERGIDYQDLKGRTAIMCCREFSKALTLDTKIPTPTGFTTMEEIAVGDEVYDRNGDVTTVVSKSTMFLKPTYKMTLEDGRILMMSEDHDNIVWKRHNKRVGGRDVPMVQGLKEHVVTAEELYEEGLFWNRTVTSKQRKSTECKYFIPKMTKPFDRQDTDFPLDAYTVGLILGDGSISKDTGFTRITSHNDDVEFIMSNIPYTIGTINTSKENVSFFSIKGIGPLVKEYIGTANVYSKRVPEKLLLGSYSQRLAVLQGLMDTDGTVNTKGSTSFTSVSIGLAEDVQQLVWSLGGSATISKRKTDSDFGVAYSVMIRVNETIFRLPRKADRQIHVAARDKVGIVDMELVHTRPTKCITVASPTKSFLAGDYVVTHNSTLVGTYLPLFMAWKGEIPGYGKVNYGLYIGDSMRNNVKTTMNTIEKVFLESTWLLDQFEMYRFTDEVMELVRHPRTPKEIAEYKKYTEMGKKKEQVPGRSKRTFSMKGVGAMALPLDATLHTEYGTTTIGECEVGDMIYGADGELCTITKKSEVFHKPMYKINLEDGRSIDVSEDHINSIVHKTVPSRKTEFKTIYEKMDVTTTELLKMKMFHTRYRNGTVHNERLLFIENCKSLQYPDKVVAVDPYTLGVFLGDGTIKKNKRSVRVTCHEDDLPTYQRHIPYELGKIQSDIRSPHVKTFTILGVGEYIDMLGLSVNSYEKFIPKEYFYCSENQRLALLQGLIDTDGTVSKDRGKARYVSTSKQLAYNVANLVRSLGGRASVVTKNVTNTTSYTNGRKIISKRDTYLVYIWLDMPIARLPRKMVLQTSNMSVYGKYVAIIAIERIELVPSQCIAVDNEEHQFITGDYIRTHNTGTRGTRSGLQRPQFAIFDDLVPSESDANSEAVLTNIENTIDSDVLQALHGAGSFAMIIGTPYNKKDPVYQRLESGSWVPVVFPICKDIRLDMPREEFQSVWSDRHGYDKVMRRYKNAAREDKLRSFNQELMLRISSEEDRLIPDSYINWFKRSDIIHNGQDYNWYITTDFTTSGKKGNDFSGIAVWAVNSNHDYMLVDISLKKLELAEQYNELFRLVNRYKRFTGNVEVGIETDGQQKAHIFAVQQMMAKKNEYFTLGKQKGATQLGIGSGGVKKFERFRMNAVPLFQNGKIWLAEDLKSTADMQELLTELQYTTYQGFGSGHDDGVDLITQVGIMETYAPSAVNVQTKHPKDKMWWDEEEQDSNTGLNSYIV